MPKHPPFGRRQAAGIAIAARGRFGNRIGHSPQETATERNKWHYGAAVAVFAAALQVLGMLLLRPTEGETISSCRARCLSSNISSADLSTLTLDPAKIAGPEEIKVFREHLEARKIDGDRCHCEVCFQAPRRISALCPSLLEQAAYLSETEVRHCPDVYSRHRIPEEHGHGSYPCDDRPVHRSGMA